MDLRLGERSLPALDSARVESLLGYLLLHRIVAHDPLREESHRLLMQFCHAADDRPRALRAYHVCATTLERELGIEPSPATRAVYEALVASPAADRAGTSPFVGRAAEHARRAGAAGGGRAAAADRRRHAVGRRAVAAARSYLSRAAPSARMLIAATADRSAPGARASARSNSTGSTTSRPRCWPRASPGGRSTPPRSSASTVASDRSPNLKRTCWTRLLANFAYSNSQSRSVQQPIAPIGSAVLARL
jgi:hypothetical protein